MRDVVLQMGISIDGYVSGGPEQGIGGGDAEHEDVVARKMAWVSKAGVHAMGRVTYEGMSGFWPTSTDEYAKPMNDIPRSCSPRPSPGRTGRAARSPAETSPMRSRISSPGLAVRSSSRGVTRFAQALTRANLIDEYRLITRPIALDSGEPMFNNLPTGRRLELVEATPYPDRTVISIYRRPR